MNSLIVFNYYNYLLKNLYLSIQKKVETTKLTFNKNTSYK